WGGFLLFSWPLQILYIALSIIGVYCFVASLSSGGYSLVAAWSGSYLLGAAILVALLFLSILIHELAHALTVKHYGREVREAGPMIYFGFPGFFVDTTDIWMEGKRARLAVSWSGPYSGLVLAGMASIAITIWPGAVLNGILFRFAFLTYLLVFLNLNPLLKLDGYYLLMDWLEIPMLREKSLAFLRTGLPAKLRQLGRQPGDKMPARRWLRGLGGFSREEWIFTLFGLLSALWTLYAVYLGISFWQSRLAAAAGDLFVAQESALDYLLTVLVILVSAAFLLLMVSYPLRLLVGILRGAAQRGVFANAWLLAVLMLALAALLALVSFLLPGTVAGAALGFAALLASLFLAGRNAVSYAGSRFVPVSAMLGLAALAWLADGFLSLLREGAFSPSAGWVVADSLHLLALLALCAAACTLLVGAGFRPLWTGVWVFAALGLIAGAGLAAYQWANLSHPVNLGRLALLAQVLLPALGLGLLAPSLLAFLRTASSPAWAALALVFGWLVSAALLDLSRVPAYLLLACTLALHSLALSQVRFRSEGRTVAIDLDDMRRLQRAFTWTMEGVLGQVREIAGERQARQVAEAFTRYARASQWPVELALGEGALEHVTDATPVLTGLVERGETYAAALNLLLDLVTHALGT
ncbi:MAG: hypothetical protein GWN58_40540, partial [Anaerolineae bacterium]|nr:hypothetical protein [Anaerolineae bacterium]